MRLVVDMNLSPRWGDYLRDAGLEADHWSTIGETTATDAVIMQTAQQRGDVVLTNDLDFGAMLASSGAEGPSVIQIRSADLRPQALAPMLDDARRNSPGMLIEFPHLRVGVNVAGAAAGSGCSGVTG